MKKKIECVFYKGSGKDPLELPAELAACQVCGGIGKVEVAEPAIKCAFCEATGVYPRNALVTCIFCDGKGLVTVKDATPSIKAQTQLGTMTFPALDAQGKRLY